MATRSNLGTGIVSIVGAGDTTIFTPSGIERYQVGSFNVFNSSAGALTLNVYISPDLTSASGKLIFTQTIASFAEIDVNTVVGQGYLLDNVIGTVTEATNGLSAQLTRTEYDSGS